MGRLVLGVDIIVVSPLLLFSGIQLCIVCPDFTVYLLHRPGQDTYGFDTAKVAYIITQYPEEVFRRIDTELDAVLPTLTAGRIFRKPTKVILTAIKMRQIGQLTDRPEVDPVLLRHTLTRTKCSETASGPTTTDSYSQPELMEDNMKRVKLRLPL